MIQLTSGAMQESLKGIQLTLAELRSHHVCLVIMVSLEWLVTVVHSDPLQPQTPMHDLRATPNFQFFKTVLPCSTSILLIEFSGLLSLGIIPIFTSTFIFLVSVIYAFF